MDPVEIEKWEAMEARLIKKLHELKDTMKLDMKQALGLPLSSPTPTTSAASNGKFFLPDSTCIASAQKVFDEMPSHQEKTRVGVLHVIVSQVRYPLIKEVFHQVFDPFGVVDNVYVYERTDRVTALITFRSCMEVAQAQEAMHGRCIYNGCCWMDIQLLIVLTSSNMMTPAKCSTSPCSIHNTDELTAKSTLVAASAASTTTYATATTSSLVGDILERFVQAHASSSLTQQQLLEVVTNMGLKCPQEDVPGVQWDPGIMSLIIMDGTSNTERYNTWCIAHGGFAWVLVVVVHIYLLKIGVMFTRMPSGLATYTEEIVQRLLELLVLYLTLIQYNLLKKLVQFLVRLSWATSLVFTTAWGPNTLLFEEVLPYIGCQELTVCCEQRRGKNTTEVTNRPWAQHEEGKEVTVFLLLQVLGGATMSTQAKEKCPLCLETMDLIDKQLKPCKCGYEICLWCWHHIMEMDQKDECGGRCPGCRSFYNKDSILGTCISSQILKELCPDKSNLQKEQIKSQKQKSAKSQLRVAEELIDPNNARVIQRKLVYIVGMPSEFAKDKGRGSCPVQRGG